MRCLSQGLMHWKFFINIISTVSLIIRATSCLDLAHPITTAATAYQNPQVPSASPPCLYSSKRRQDLTQSLTPGAATNGALAHTATRDAACRRLEACRVPPIHYHHLGRHCQGTHSLAPEAEACQGPKAHRVTPPGHYYSWGSQYLSQPLSTGAAKCWALAQSLAFGAARCWALAQSLTTRETACQHPEAWSVSPPHPCHSWDCWGLARPLCTGAMRCWTLAQSLTIITTACQRPTACQVSPPHYRHPGDGVTAVACQCPEAHGASPSQPTLPPRPRSLVNPCSCYLPWGYGQPKP
ncbi:uncharacterized protein LOC103168221 [Ornithorhynchus anatinus]|uniref:uncharacterized protein LOC103168221 n=1 Tax=Ornithorhynchus anatinus TaxID=9258 RepID=UPI0010A76071|nr:uncharacterized protein LOC103168221 [Ornithorhynchus anatinus]